MGAWRGRAGRPEFLRLKPLAELPKERSLLSGSIVRMRRSRSLRTSSLTAISSVVGRSWMTNSKRHCEKSCMKRWRDMGRLCCCGGELGVRKCWRDEEGVEAAGEWAKVVAIDERGLHGAGAGIRPADVEGAGAEAGSRTRTLSGTVLDWGWRGEEGGDEGRRER